MINNGYLAVNLSSEKTIFEKTKGSDYIIHGLFVDDKMHISSCEDLTKELIDKYSKDFEVTGGGLMKTFLGMEVEQSGKTNQLHLILMTSRSSRSTMIASRRCYAPRRCR